METEKEIDFMSLVRIIAKRKIFIFVFILLFTTLAIFKGLVSPNIYKCESIVSLPETMKCGIYTDSKDAVYTLVNVYETREIINHFWDRVKKGNGVDTFNPKLLNNIYSIEIENIRGSDLYFKLIVKVKNDSKFGIEASNEILMYLQGNKFIKYKYETEKKGIESKLLNIKKSIEEAKIIRETVLKNLRERNSVGFNPVDIEIKINQLQDDYNNNETNLALFHGYQYINSPYIEYRSISPKIIANSILAAILGFFIGVILIIFYHFIKGGLTSLEKE